MIAALVLLSLPMTVLDQPKIENLVKSAKDFVSDLAKQDYEKASRDFDKTMQEKAPPEKLKSIWNEITSKLGAVKKQSGTRTEKLGTYQIVFVTCEFEKATLDIRVNYDKDGKLAGFSIVPTKAAYEFKAPTYANKESFVETEIVLGDGRLAASGNLDYAQGYRPVSWRRPGAWLGAQRSRRDDRSEQSISRPRLGTRIARNWGIARMKSERGSMEPRSPISTIRSPSRMRPSMMP